MNNTQALEGLLSQAVDTGEYTNIVDKLLAMSETTEEDPTICFYLGLLLVRMKNFQSGIRYLEIAKNAKLDPGQKLRCLIFLGKAYADVKAFSKAERAFREALQTGVPEPGAYSALGAVFFERNMIKQAIDALKKALEIDPNYVGAINNLGYIYVETQKNVEEGIELCKRAVELDPQNPAYRDSLAKALMMQGDYVGAKEHLEYALGIDPDNAVIFNRIKEIKRKLES